MTEPSTQPSRHVVLYDRDCGFCKRSLNRILRFDRHARLRGVAIQSDEGQRLLATVAPEERLDSWHLVAPGGEVLSAGAAAPALGRLLPPPFRWPLAPLLGAFPRLTERAYRWVADHREFLGRFLVLVAAVSLASGPGLALTACGSTVQEGSELTVYVSGGEEVFRGAERALAAGAMGEGKDEDEPLIRVVPVDTEEAGGDWRQTRIAASAREATRDSVSVAYIGEDESSATRVSAPITNGAGLMQVAPGRVAEELLRNPGSNDPPADVQTSGQRTLIAVGGGGSPEERGYTAMAIVLDAVARAGDPLDRASVIDAALETSGLPTPLGDATVDPGGQAVFSAGS